MAKGDSTGETGKNPKIKKQIKKAGGAAKQLAQQPIVGELVAAALTAAAASLAAKSRSGKGSSGEAAALASETLKETAAIGPAVKKALLDAARTLLDNMEGKSASGGQPEEKMLASSAPEQGGTAKRSKKKRA